MVVVGQDGVYIALLPLQEERLRQTVGADKVGIEGERQLNHWV